jgi:hypothetical protein
MEIVSAAVPRAAAGAADVRLPRHTEGAGVHSPRPTEAHHPGLWHASVVDPDPVRSET